MYPKNGDYCVNISGDGVHAYGIYQALNVNGGIASYVGKTFIAGAWVLATTPGVVYLAIQSNGTGGHAHYSGYHTGSGNWEWLTVEAYPVPADATTFSFYFMAAAGCTTVAYMDGAAVVEGSVIIGHGPSTTPFQNSITTQTDVSPIGSGTNYYYQGQQSWTDTSDHAISSISVKLSRTAGSITGKTFYIRIWTMNGDNLLDNVAISNPITGVNSWAATTVNFTFSNLYLYVAGTTITITIDMGGVDGSNYASIYDTTPTSINGALSRWLVGKTRGATYATYDVQWIIYEEIPKMYEDWPTLIQSARVLSFGSFERTLQPWRNSVLESYQGKQIQNMEITFDNSDDYFSKLFPTEPFLGRPISTFVGFELESREEHMCLFSGVVTELSVLNVLTLSAEQGV